MRTRLLQFILSRLDPRAAPIITRLVNLTKPPSLDAAALIGIGLFAVSTVIGFGMLRVGDTIFASRLITPVGFVQIIRVTHPLLFIPVAVLPVVTAGVAAALAARDTQSERLMLLNLTHLTGRAIFQGYVAAALYRMRIVLAIAFAVIPLYVFFWTASAILQYNLAGVGNHIDNGDVPVRVLYFLMIFGGLWSFNLLAPIIAVRIGLRDFSPSGALAWSLAGVATILLLWGGLINLLSPALVMPLEAYGPQPLIPRMVAVAIASMLPILIAHAEFQRRGRLLGRVVSFR